MIALNRKRCCSFSSITRSYICIWCCSIIILYVSSTWLYTICNFFFCKILVKRCFKCYIFCTECCCASFNISCCPPLLCSIFFIFIKGCRLWIISIWTNTIIHISNTIIPCKQYFFFWIGINKWNVRCIYNNLFSVNAWCNMHSNSICFTSWFHSLTSCNGCSYCIVIIGLFWTANIDVFYKRQCYRTICCK